MKQPCDEAVAETRERIQVAISQAFVFGFRLVMLICACLAIISAAVAFRLIPRKAAAVEHAADGSDKAW